MPNAVNRRRRGRRTTRRTTYRPPGAVTASFNTPNGIPDRLFNQYPYAQVVELASTFTPVSQVFRTSMFDPDLTGTGHQPFMRDEISALFQKYRCFGFKYDITIENLSTAISARYSVAPFNHTGVPPTMNLLWEKPNGKWGVLAPAGQANAVVHLTGYLNAAAVLGVTRERFKLDDIYASTVGANPNNPAYLIIHTQASDDATSITCRVQARLTMYTLHFNRAIIGTS